MLTLRGDRAPFALVGEWAGARAVLGSAPTHLAEGDPFETLAAAAPLDGHGDGVLVGGGWFGWLGYGLGALVEDLPAPPPARRALPESWLGWYDHVVVLADDGWRFEALWTPERDAVLRERLALWRERLAAPAPEPRPFAAGPFAPVAPGAAGHVGAVAEAVGRIARGELFQANVCLRLEASFAGAAVDVFAAGIAAARPRFGALFGDSVVSLSPERFLRRVGRRVETDPIKGTAADPDTLRESAKDAAEHVMIVDLMRNDLGRVCAYGTIEAHLPRVEAHANVFSLVSTVSGTLRDDATDADLLRATFPPGSVTGAPKVQAMKTISRLEASARGVYTGAIGYASPIAGLELSVAIRTFEAAAGRIWLGAGGGIVADSDPEAELAEALAKASGPIAAIGARRDGFARRARGASALPRALDYGPRPDPAAGVFTTTLVVDGVVQREEENLARLAASVRELYGVDLPAEARRLLREAAAKTRGRARARLDVRPDAGGLVLAASAAPTPPDSPPATLTPFLLPGGLGAHKWIDRRLADALGEHAAPGTYPVLVDGDGLVLETHRTNVWVAEGDDLITPEADGRILPGVTRAHVLRAPNARAEPVSLARLHDADRILLTSAVVLVRELGGASRDRRPALPRS